jgi:hypothetical protein
MNTNLNGFCIQTTIIACREKGFEKAKPSALIEHGRNDK